MWTALFPNWKKFKFYFFSKEAPQILERLSTEKFNFEIFKRSSSHYVFILSSFKEKKPLFLLKAFRPKLFKTNKVRKYLRTLYKLRELNISVIRPIILFWENPQIAFLKRKPLYGGIIFPYIERGFIKKEDIFLDDKKEKVNYELIKNLVSFLFKLHEKGIYLKDTKYNNFYYFEGDFKIFDLEGIKFYKKPLFKFERLKDLSTLAMVLEWQKVKNARELIFYLYKQLYFEISEKDFGKFNCLVNKKRKKREKKFATSSY
ncbi:MAG: hypothetical protein MW689_001710 [Thermodesulfobacteria bacterium]|nr:hypothetical protein [Thermodesulfobacteriota bacterium]MCU4138139.1 hypothetical protein [Thermodesulfobacteriota bacterium]